MSTPREDLIAHIRFGALVDEQHAIEILHAAGVTDGQMNDQSFVDKVLHPDGSPEGVALGDKINAAVQEAKYPSTAAGQAKQASDQAAQTQQTQIAEKSAIVNDQTAAPADRLAATNDLAQLISGLPGVGGKNIPRDVLQLVGGGLSTDQATRAMSLWNSLNPNDHISSVDEFYLRVSAQLPMAFEVLGKVAEGVGNTSYSVWDPASKTMKQVTIPRANLTAFVDANPAVASTFLGSAVAASARTGNEVPWQLIGPAAQLTHQVKSDESQIGAKKLYQANVEGDTDVWAFQSDRTAQALQAGKRQYGDDLLALVALRDPQLAAAIYTAGGVTSDQATKVQQIFIDAGLGGSPSEVSQRLAQQGLAVDQAKLAALTDPSAGPAGVKVALPDSTKLESAARDLYRVWFAREATPDELSQFVQTIDAATTAKAQDAVGNVFKGVGQTTGVSIDQQVDTQGRLESQLRDTPEFQQLMGQKPIGVSETEWANQFRVAGSNLLGGAIPNSDAVRLGMKTGNVNDTIAYQFGDKSSQDNSSFQQRLARAAQAIAQVT